jgi:hypothetical protein
MNSLNIKKRVLKTLVSFLFLFIIFSNCKINSQDNSLTVNYGFSVDVNSKYLWRGLTYSTGSVVQPSAYATIDNFTAGIWSNIEPSLEKDKYNETDIYFSYSYEFKKLKIEPSLQYYYYSGEDASPATGEFILKLAYPVYKELYVFTTHNIDVMKYTGAYYGEGGLSIEHWFNDKLGMTSSASLGWASSKFNRTYISEEKNKTSLSLFSFNISGSYYPKSWLYFKLRLETYSLIDEDLKLLSDVNPIIGIGGTVGVEF